MELSSQAQAALSSKLKVACSVFKQSFSWVKLSSAQLEGLKQEIQFFFSFLLKRRKTIKEDGKGRKKEKIGQRIRAGHSV